VGCLEVALEGGCCFVVAVCLEVGCVSGAIGKADRPCLWLVSVALASHAAFGNSMHRCRFLYECFESFVWRNPFVCILVDHVSMWLDIGLHYLMV
jgi:hypothetical protein